VALHVAGVPPAAFDALGTRHDLRYDRQLQRFGFLQEPERALGKLWSCTRGLQRRRRPTCFGPMIRDLSQSMNVLRAETCCKPVDRMCELLVLLQRAVRQICLERRGQRELIGGEAEPDRRRRQLEMFEL